MSAPPSFPKFIGAVVRLDQRKWAQETLQQLRGLYHALPLDDRLTVRRALREMAEEGKQ